VSSFEEILGPVTLSTPWVLSTLVLAVAVAVGVAWVRRGAQVQPRPQSAIDSEALEEKKRSLLRQLEELDLERDRISAGVYADEHARLVAESAD